MSLYGMMRTGVSGMNAQANRLSTVADNIANSSTTGYKRSSTEFSSLILPTVSGNYTSGGVNTTVRMAISQQGDLKYTTSGSDLAINGSGFFVVQNSSGSPVLTRAGNFVLDSEGRLINAAGFQLMGLSCENGTPGLVASGFGGLVPITVRQDLPPVAVPSTTGVFTANLPASADPVAVAADRPSANAAGATYTAKTSLVAYDNLGGEVLLDVYYTKTGANTWEVAVYNQADATAGTGFPYAARPGYPVTQALTFDGTTGKLTGAASLALTVPNGQPLTIDLSKMTQLDTSYTVVSAKLDGAPPAGIEGIQIADDGTIYAKYENGALKPLYIIPIADVPSPDLLQALPGNVYTLTKGSGDVKMDWAGQGGRGSVIAGALENSNVDIAEELTNMIESQRNYTANSKVFQTGADLMDILVNLKR